MISAIGTFAFVLTLGSGDWVAFYIISVLSGAAVAADMTLLPAMLSARVAELGTGRDGAFGLWGFVNKATLAIAAGLTLPALSYAGYQPGLENSATALGALSLSYGALPCALKLVALALLLTSPDKLETKP